MKSANLDTIMKTLNGKRVFVLVMENGILIVKWELFMDFIILKLI